MSRIGEVFGRITVTGVHSQEVSGKRWICECSCGTITNVHNSNLRSGRTQSCGCLAREKSSQRARKHGDTGSPEFVSWVAMRRRCRNTTCAEYPHYGGRGIAIAERWDTYETFLLDMGRRPSPDHWLERINNDGDYEPSNCKWATIFEQSLNRRNSRLIEIDGVSRNMKLWSLISGVSMKLIWYRLSKGWDAKKAVFQPARKMTFRKHQNSPASSTVKL